MKLHRVWLVPGLLVLALAGTGAGAATELERAAREIEGKLMAPCCGANTVHQHDSGLAQQIRQEIRAMLAEGQTEQEIIAVYVERYGDKVLAMPEARGFSLLAYLLPGAFLLVGTAALGLVVLRWRRPAAEEPTPPPAVAEADEDYMKRLERELHDLG